MDRHRGRAVDAWIERQDGNDALLRSIWRADTAVGVMAGVSAACLLASAVLGTSSDRSALVTVSPAGEVRLAWRLRWK